MNYDFFIYLKFNTLKNILLPFIFKANK